MKAVKITDTIYWVGAVDWTLRNFHGYTTSMGSTYNAYLIVDQTIALIDTVKANFAGEMLERIASVVDPSRIEIIVSNHVEPDHSGSFPAVLQAAPNARVVTSDPAWRERGFDLRRCHRKPGTVHSFSVYLPGRGCCPARWPAYDLCRLHEPGQGRCDEGVSGI